MPVRYLKQIYSPMADGRRFESLNVDYVDAADHNPRYLRDADVENGCPLQEIEVFFVPRRLARKEKTPLERGFAYDAV